MACIEHAWPRYSQEDAQIYEVEDVVLSGVAVDTAQAGYSGTGYVGGFDDAADTITFNIDNDSVQLYDLSIRYAGIYGAKVTTVVLNGGARTDMSLDETTDFTTASGGQILLEEGANTIDIVSNWGYYLIDYIAVSPSAPRPAHNITPTLSNPNANATATALYEYLISIYGKNILSGQQDATWADWVTQQVGKTLAVLGVDLIDYSPSRVEHGSTSTAVEDAIAHAEKGGIVTVVWHWNAPAGLYDTDEEPWWSGFYTVATDFDVAAALSDTTNANYTLLIRDIDAIAGAWFWWGAKGAEPCKQLWNLVYDRWTNFHGINNLVWVCNSVGPESYPGDEVTDILSTDVYATGNGPMSAQYNSLIDLGNDTKLIAAAEVGSVPLPEQLQAYEADWVWFCTWGDTFINNEEYSAIDVLTVVSRPAFRF
ncbi:carbohydrate-binding module family 35 [Xylaria bambusicola]|uniref:carbohydrate-binding module family 35 n=1 Tax=Xylaria bambusicola TaxID=326684 RepID=UPI002008D8D7|nr:carbohydrate-binding module family 35 [Xylaria bambusicola]KAI0505350.1 carbohydrate-binding module family 35 [Xylaria bambusicola]